MESLVSDIPARDGKTANLFLQCMLVGPACKWHNGMPLVSHARLAGLRNSSAGIYVYNTGKLTILIHIHFKGDFK
jgi:hypothetical protein